MARWLVAAWLLLPSLVAAEEIPLVTREARTALSLTVYASDLGLVHDTREFALPSGESRLRLEDVAAKIDPPSVTVRSISQPDALAVLEQRVLADPPSPDRLLRAAVGQEVDLVETGERLRMKVTRATLLSAEQGGVYRIGDRVAIGHPGRVVLSTVPAATPLRPAVLWRLANGGPARQRVAITYLTHGLGWTSDAVLVLGEDDARGDLTTWATVANESGGTYENATLKLVAGQVKRARPAARAGDLGMAMAEARVPGGRFGEEELLDYHLYTLDGPVTIAEHETVQLRLLAATGVPVRRSYLLVGQPPWYRSPAGDLQHDVPVGVALEFRNDTASRLGTPLPAGTVRVYRRDRSGEAQFVGEDTIRHTPKDERVVLRIGQAFDVVASRVQTDFRTVDLAPYDVEAAFRVSVRNRRREAVAVSVREPIGGAWKVLDSSHPPVKVDAATLGFELPVPAGGETVLAYRVQIAR